MSAYLAGANARRVRKALFALLKGARQQRCGEPCLAQGEGGLEAWRNRSLAEEDIVHLLLDGMVVKTQLNSKATTISVLVALGM